MLEKAISSAADTGGCSPSVEAAMRCSFLIGDTAAVCSAVAAPVLSAAFADIAAVCRLLLLRRSCRERLQCKADRLA